MSPRPYLSLRHRDFRRLWVAQLISLTGSQMQAAAIDWHVYLLTRSPLALGMVGLSRVIPIVSLSLLGGVVADRYDRKRVMLLTQLTMTAVAALLGFLTLAHHETLFTLYLLTGMTSAAGAFDNPARQAFVPRLVPRDDLPGALAMNLTMFHAGMIGGPAIAGVLIASAGEGTRGLAWIYMVNAVSFLAVLATLLTMRASGRVEALGVARESPMSSLRQGLRFVFSTPVMVWTMALDFVATFFSGANALLPIFADQVLKVGAFGFGWLRAAPALGALVGSIYTSLKPIPRRQGRVFLWAVAAYGFATVVFGLSRSYALTFLALAATGLADLVSTVVRQIVRQMITPDSMRGRMTSVNMIFFMGGPQLGELEAGLVAALFASAAIGATVSVVSGGVATIVAAGMCAWRAKVVRDYVTSRPPPALRSGRSSDRPPR
jgi:MFS family permease